MTGRAARAILRKSRRAARVPARLAIAAAPALWAIAPVSGLAQHSYMVGPPNPILEAQPMGPVRNDTDRDRFCIGGYNAEVPYARNTCFPPLSRQFTMTLTLDGTQPAAPAEIARPTDLPKALASCWAPQPPPDGQSWQTTLRIAFAADGRILATPRVTYISAPDKAARAYLRESLLALRSRCGKFRFTPPLGKAIAGRPFAIRFILKGK